MSKVKCKMSIMLNFCRSVPPELLRSFFSSKQSYEVNNGLIVNLLHFLLFRQLLRLLCNLLTECNTLFEISSLRLIIMAPKCIFVAQNQISNAGRSKNLGLNDKFDHPSVVILIVSFNYQDSFCHSHIENKLQQFSAGN